MALEKCQISPQTWLKIRNQRFCIKIETQMLFLTQ